MKRSPFFPGRVNMYIIPSDKTNFSSPGRIFCVKTEIVFKRQHPHRTHEEPRSNGIRHGPELAVHGRVHGFARLRVYEVKAKLILCSDAGPQTD